MHGVGFTGDTLLDLVDGRKPQRYELTSSRSPREIADELRRRLRGNTAIRDWRGIVELRADEAPRMLVRIRPLTPDPKRDRDLDAPIVTARSAVLTPDGVLQHPYCDLVDRHLRMSRPDGFERAPETLLVLARLIARPSWSVDEETLAAATRARESDALTRAPIAHLGLALEDLLATPEARDALVWLDRLAPATPLAPDVVVDHNTLGAALATDGDHRRTYATLRALAPNATRDRIRSFARGARLA